MKKFIVLLFVLGLFTKIAIAQVLSADTQIKEAISALPEENRTNVKVLGYNADGEMVVLQKGGNGFVCLADDPNKKGFSVSCYTTDLEPFMERGRTLQKENKTFKEIFDIREKEAKTGTLKMPKNPATLHVLSGESLEKANYRYVVYIPSGHCRVHWLTTQRDCSGRSLDHGSRHTPRPYHDYATCQKVGESWLGYTSE